jgi:hypothetical protein
VDFDLVGTFEHKVKSIKEKAMVPYGSDKMLQPQRRETLMMRDINRFLDFRRLV